MASILALTAQNYDQSIYAMTLPELLLTLYLVENGLFHCFALDLNLDEMNALVEKSARTVEAHSEKLFSSVDHETNVLIAEIFKNFHDEFLSLQHLKNVSAVNVRGPTAALHSRERPND